MAELEQPNRMVTQKLIDSDEIWKVAEEAAATSYRRVPSVGGTKGASSEMVWRVRFDLAFNPSRFLALDIVGEFVMGRGDDGPDFVSLLQFDAEALGVSRRHVMIRPSATNLYVSDLGSTNGTHLNGLPIGINSPYSLSNGDLLRIGELELIVNVFKRPSGYTGTLQPKQNIAETILPVSRAIASCLDLKEVFERTLESTISLTGAGEASIWLIDDQTGELFLEAERGMKTQMKHTRLAVSDPLVEKVIQSGAALRISHGAHESPLKIATGYFVSSLIYVPLQVGGFTIGILSAVHPDHRQSFDAEDEQIMKSIGEMTGVAIQNARLFQSINHTVYRQKKMISGLQDTLTYRIKKLLNNAHGFVGLLEGTFDQDEYAEKTLADLQMIVNEMMYEVQYLTELAAYSNATLVHREVCDLVEIVRHALEMAQIKAAATMVDVEHRLIGHPKTIEGNRTQLISAVSGLLLATIQQSGAGARITVDLVFDHNEVIIRVVSPGTQIGQGDIALMLDEYFSNGNGAAHPEKHSLVMALIWAAVEAHRGSIRIRSLDASSRELIIVLPCKPGNSGQRPWHKDDTLIS